MGFNVPKHVEAKTEEGTYFGEKVFKLSFIFYVDKQWLEKFGTNYWVNVDPDTGHIYIRPYKLKKGEESHPG